MTIALRSLPLGPIIIVRQQDFLRNKSTDTALFDVTEAVLNAFEVIVSGKWKQERPYITSGPLIGKYVFSQLHFHWGANDMEGSEHTTDDCQSPAEMHVIFFKSCYLTQEAALKEKDGIIVMVYLIKLQDGENSNFTFFIEELNNIQTTNSSCKLEPKSLFYIMKMFAGDYFLYWGSINSIACFHCILWIISRYTIGLSLEQIDAFRKLLDGEGNLILRNYRRTKPRQNRKILHVNPSPSKIATLLPENTGCLSTAGMEWLKMKNFNETLEEHKS